MEKAALEQRRLNAEKAACAADQLFPGEQWINASSVKLKYSGEEFDLPSGIDNVNIAQSRLTGLKDNERTLAKELRQAKILTDKGTFIYLLPKLKDANGNDMPSPDAIVNGVVYEFKTITGQIDRIEAHFRDSRRQSENIYIKIDNPAISKHDVVSKFRNILNNKTYDGGTNGNLLVYLAQTKRIYFFRIIDFCKKNQGAI